MSDPLKNRVVSMIDQLKAGRDDKQPEKLALADIAPETLAVISDEIEGYYLEPPTDWPEGAPWWWQPTGEDGYNRPMLQVDELIDEGIGIICEVHGDRFVEDAANILRDWLPGALNTHWAVGAGGALYPDDIEAFLLSWAEGNDQSGSGS